ncbi:MAG TPA: ABC transporter permease, partial [Candidatus Acidoferrales bacterium]|nr:ABC transporter permease [Candidatus Acidoferrales bacterium]
MSLIRRFANLFHRSQLDEEIDAELRSHIEMRTADNIAAGMSPQEARRQAVLRFGSRPAMKERVVAADAHVFLYSVWQDLRYGLRALRKSPGFTAVAVLTLALGIGANSAMFSVVDAVLLRPLPFDNPSRLMMIGEGFPSLGFPNIGVSAQDFTIYAREQKSFESIGAFQNKNFDLSGGAEPERAIGARVSASIFQTLGAQPLLGRTFTAREDNPGIHVVVLSYGLWQRRYAGNRAIVGRIITLDRVPYTVIGVMPKQFRFPMRGPQDMIAENNQPADLWVPLGLTPEELQWNGMYANAVLGRLKPGITFRQAQAEANVLSEQIEHQYPAGLLKAFNDARLHMWVSSFHNEVVSSVRTLLLVLMAAVSMVLLIACANVATLLLSRATSRQREIAIRTALGASRLRLARQMLTESLVLAAAGGVIGILIARVGAGALLSLAPSTIPLPHEVSFSGSVLLFVGFVCCLTTIIFGLAPAFPSSGTAFQGSLQESGRSGTPAPSQQHLQKTFVIAEFALAFVLLISAGLLIRSLAQILRTNPGFRPDHVLTMSVPLPDEAYSKASEIRNFYQRLARRVSDLPDVGSTTITTDLPTGRAMAVALKIQERPGLEPPVDVSWILGNYFSTMGIRLIKGRVFTPEDRAGSQAVVIISDGIAKKFWPRGDAIGKHLVIAGTPGMATVVGIVGDADDAALGTTPWPHVYVPYLQVPDELLEDKEFNFARAMKLAVRTSLDPTVLTSALTTQ